MTRVCLGLDVGSVSTNLVALDNSGEVVFREYTLTAGDPIAAVRSLMQKAGIEFDDRDVAGVGTTGSGRALSAAIVGADTAKNEITAHAIAALSINPRVRTIVEIGGQDSKMILLENGIVTDFAMNTVCAAGTGSFLDRQAARLGLPIAEFGRLALLSENPVRIAGRCAVFAETDMIHKQQIGCKTEDIVRGLCEALVRNYLNNVGKAKQISEPVFFQGGVAANAGIRKALTEALGCEVFVPPDYDVMGAVGAAILSKRTQATSFRGFDLACARFESRGFVCDGCPNNCEIVELSMDAKVVARWGGRCDKWERLQEAGT